MQKTLIKFAPQAMVLAVALYWSWPALKAAFPQVADARRQGRAQEADGAGVRRRGAIAEVPSLPQTQSVPIGRLHTEEGRRQARAGKSAEEADTATKVAAIRDSGLVLNATCIMGKQRMAIINGRVYKEKEAIPQPGDETPSCFVTAILPHKVLLSCQGEIRATGLL